MDSIRNSINCHIHTVLKRKWENHIVEKAAGWVPLCAKFNYFSQLIRFDYETY